MNSRNMNWVLIIIISLYSFIGVAQENDVGLWLKGSIEKKVSKKFNIQLSESIRLNNNITEFSKFYTEIAASYKIIKRLNLSVAYRFSQKKRPNDSYSFRHRYNIDLSYKIKIDNLSIIIRERFQSRYKNVESSKNGAIPVNQLVTKLKFKYNINKKNTPFVSADAYYLLAKHHIGRVRFKAGIDYEFNKFNNLSLYYMLDKHVNTKKPRTNHIIGIGYTYSF